MDKALPRKPLIDESKILLEKKNLNHNGEKDFSHSTENILQLYKKKTCIDWRRSSSRGDQDSNLPFFMQNQSHRHSLSLILGKSLRENHYSEGTFIP